MAVIKKLEIFKEGDYSESGKGVWGEEEFLEVQAALGEMQKTRNRGIPIIFSRKKDGHGSNQATLGTINKLTRRADGIWLSDGTILDEFAKILKQGAFSEVSTGFAKLKSTGKWIIDHVAALGTALSEVTGMSPIYEAIFSSDELEENIIIDFSSTQETEVLDLSKNKKKVVQEETLPDAITQKDIDFAIKDTKSTVTQEFKQKLEDQKVTFSSQIGDLETKVTELEAAKKAEEEKVVAMEAKFAKEKADADKTEIAAFIKGNAAILPAQANAVFSMLFSEKQKGVKEYDIAKSVFENKKNELTFGPDQVPGNGESEYAHFAKKTTDNTGNVSVTVDVSGMYEFGEFQEWKALNGK